MGNQIMMLGLKTKFRSVVRSFCKLFFSRGVSIFAIYKILILMSVFILLGVGCSGSRKNLNEAPPDLKEVYDHQRSYVVSSSVDNGRPDWVHKTSFEKDGKMCFSGGFLNGSDYAVTIRCANAEALKVAVQGISQYIRSEFTAHVQGSNTDGDSVDRYVEDGLATFTNNIHTQGINQAEIYYEEVISGSVMKPTFNAFVRLEMKKSDYLKAKVDVLNRLRNDFGKNGQIAAKKKAEELLDNLKMEVIEESRQGV